jgi:hypothetical protein
MDFARSSRSRRKRPPDRMAAMWKFDEALPLLRQIVPIAERNGFSVALYGSVLAIGESSNDLDLFFIEQSEGAGRVHICLDEIARLPEVRTAGTAMQGVGGAFSIIRLHDGRIVDAQFRSKGAVYSDCVEP